MAITNFDFPSVTLSQVFEAAPTGNVSNLSVACIGPYYKIHKYTDAGEASKLVPSSGTVVVGSPCPIPNMTSGYTYDTSAGTHRVAIRNAKLGYQATDATFKAQGAASGKKFTFTKSVLDYGKFADRPARAGDTVKLVSGGTTTIATIESITANGTQVSFSEVPVSGGTLTSATFCETINDVIRLEATAGTVTNYSFDAGDDSVTVATTAVHAGSISAAESVVDGEFYLEYREYNAAPAADPFSNKVGSVDDPSQVASVLGTPCKDNPLALAVYFAAATSNGNAVYFTAVAHSDAATPSAYDQALGLLERYENIYSIVPATCDASVNSALLTSIQASDAEDSKIRRTLWCGLKPTYPTLGDVVDAIIAARGSINSFRAQAVWGDDALFNGEIVENYALAAAAAGMRSGEAPHRPISNLPYTFFSLEEPHGLSRTQLKRIGANGIWIIANNYNDVPINMRQVTTAMANNINLDEESVVANADEIALALCHIGEDMVGNSNISDVLLALLYDQVDAVLNFRTINVDQPANVGAQLIDYQIVRIWQDPTALDTVYCDIECTPPRPFNKFRMTMRVL